MAAQKQSLHELLREDQEPFHLQSYISDRKNQLNLRDDDKKKSILETTLTLKQSLCKCKHACLFSFRGSPDVEKSPAAVENRRALLHVPARTAALLLEAAMRIQGSGKLDCGLGLFGSVLKRLKERNNKNKMRGIKNVEEQRELGFSGAYNHSHRRQRLSSAGWSDEKSLDLEASSSFSEEFEEISDSPFRFSLHRCPSPGHRTPEFSSPAASPGLLRTQDKEICEEEELEKAKQKEEDNKEQCSPVSVLDHSFEDDDFKPDEEDCNNPECNYSTLQKAQQELLYKLHRFEQLADLDPIELEKLMLEDEEEEEDEEDVEENGERCGANKERVICCRDGEINPYMKMQVSNERSEENSEINDLNNRKVVFGKVYNRLDDFCRMEFEEWKSCGQQAEEIAMEIEVVMFGVLVEELSQELISGS